MGAFSHLFFLGFKGGFYVHANNFIKVTLD